MNDKQLQKILSNDNLCDIPIIYVLRVLTVVLSILEE